MDSFWKILENIFAKKAEVKEKQTPKIQSTAYPDGRIINYKK